MTEASSIYVRLDGKDVGLSTLLQKVDAQTQKSADSALRMQAQYARLAAAQGNTAQATNILSNALLNNGGASDRTVVSLSTQLATVQRGSTVFQEFGQAASRSLTGLIGPAALATGAITGLIAVGKSFADAFAFKATLDANASSLKSALEGYRDVSGTLGEATAFGRQYNITQEQTNSILTSSIDVLKQSSGSVTQLETALLRLGTRDVSKPISEAARAVRELQAGDVTSIKELFNVPAKDALAMKNQIAAGADSIQVLTAWLDKAGVGMDALALRSQGAAGKMNELAVAQEDLVLAQAQFAQGPGLALLQERIKLTSGVTRILSGDFRAMGQSIANTIAEQKASTAAYYAQASAISAGATRAEAAAAGQAAYAASLNAGAIAAQASADANAAWDAELARTGVITTGVTDIEQQRLNILNATANLLQQANTASLGYADALELTGVRARAAAEADQLKSNADQLASVNAQTHAVAQNALAQQAQIAANVLLAAGPIGARTAAILAGSSSQIDILTAAFYRLAAGKAAAGAADTKARLDKQTPRQLIGADSEEAGIRSQNRATLNEDRAARIKAANDAASAERNYQQTLGNTGPALAHARAELAQLTVGSAAYINKQNEIAQLQQKADRAAKGGGGTKLSDQQKLNNTLLADQDKANTQFEDAEQAHQDRLLKIAIDFAKKTLEQQKANEISKRQSTESFYDRLTSSELNKTKTGTDALKAIDAQYQADRQKAEELAQAGKAKQSADLLALAQKQAEEEIAYQEKVAKAQAEKDQAEVDRLAVIHKLHQDTAAEERKQVLEGGDTNENAKNQALEDEQAQYESQQDKIGTSAERAATRQETAALRAGKAIDAVNTKLGVTKSTYDQIAPAGGGSAPVTTNGASGPPSTDASASGAPAAPGDIATALQTAQDAIVMAIGQVQNATRNVEGAVRGLSGKFAT